MSKSRLKVILVDDHAVLRAGLRSLLDEQDDLEVISEANSADEVFALLDAELPQIIVMDLGMPGMNAFDAIKEIRQTHPAVKVIVLSMHKGREVVTRALEAGADGYVPKSTAHTDLLRAIRAVGRGETYLHPSAASVLVDAVRGTEEEQILLETLSERELEVLNYTARGYTSREIGAKLSISPKTVDTYRHRVMGKLKLDHRSELVDLAFKAGLLGEAVGG
ncbi:MAG: response regulator transcription factor [Anaerolineales bacterium]